MLASASVRFTFQTAKVLVPAFALAGRVQLGSLFGKRGSGAPRRTLGRSRGALSCTALPLSGSARLAALHLRRFLSPVPRFPASFQLGHAAELPAPDGKPHRGSDFQGLPRYSRAKLWRGRRIRSRIGIASRCALTGRTWFVYVFTQKPSSANDRFCANHE